MATRARTRAASAPIADAQAATADSFQNFAARLGIGTGNLSDASSYGLNPISRQRVQLEYMYRGAWLVGAAVDTVAEDMTSEGVDFVGTQGPDEIDKLDRAMVRMFWWQSICDWIKWARLFGGAIAVMLIDGQDVETPLDMDTVGLGQFKGFYVYDRWMLNTSFTGIVKELGPHLGKPEFYEPVAMSTVFGGQKIHHTRVLRMDGISLPYFQRIAEMGWGLSVIERLYDRLTAFDSATAGAGQLIFKAYLRSLKIDGLRDILAAGGKAQAALEKQVENIRLFQQTEGITLVDGKDEFATYSYTFAGLSDIMGQMAQQVSGAVEVPIVRLMGQSPAGFSTGETDLRNHYDKIRREQHSRLKEPLGRAFDVLYRSEMGHAPPPSFDIRFRPLWQVSNAERADIASKNTATILSAKAEGVVSDKVILQELRQQSELTGIWSNVTDDDIEAAADEPPAPESEGPGTEGPGGGFGGLSGIAAGSGSGGGNADTDEGKQDTVDAYDPSEARDDGGKWTAGGVSGGKKVSITKKLASLTPREKQEIDRYSGDEFLRINKELRDGKDSDPAVKHLDTALQKHAVPNGTTLYRGISREAAKSLFKGEIRVGQEVADPAYASTSYEEHSARMLAIGGVLLKIDAGDNAHGVDISGMSRNPTETEVLLPRNAKMVVTAIKKPKAPGLPVTVHLSYGDAKATTDAASDPVQLTVPLLIRLMEFARENAPKGEAGDVAIHALVERLAALGDGPLDMDAYERAVGTNTDDDAPASGWFRKPYPAPDDPEVEEFQPKGYLEPE